jgi:actin-like ATPase involved in cell morphogenesis
LYRNGIFLAGGTALLPGVDEYLKKRCKMAVNVLPDPINAVAAGCGALLEDQSSLNRFIAKESV